MPSRLDPYLNFNGTARQAMAFYADVFGGELAINACGDFGVGEPPDADRIMHAQLETDAGYTIAASDVPSGYGDQPVAGVSVSISGDDADRLRGYWDKLSAGRSSRCPWPNRSGATNSACVSTGSGWRGWSTSVGRDSPVAASRSRSRGLLGAVAKR